MLTMTVSIGLAGMRVRFRIVAVERGQGVGSDIAVGLEVGFGLEGLHRLDDGVVI